jgi:hypothetical protein
MRHGAVGHPTDFLMIVIFLAFICLTNGLKLSGDCLALSRHPAEAAGPFTMECDNALKFPSKKLSGQTGSFC